MILYWRLTMFLRLLLVTGLLSVSTTAATEVWRITSLEWPPYSGQNEPGHGIAIKQLRCYLKHQGIGLEVEFYPWKRARLIARDKEYAGYFPAWPDEVDQGFTASSTILYSRIALVGTRDVMYQDSDLDNIFNRYRIGVVDSYNYPDFITLRINRYHNNIEHSRTDASLIRKLLAGRFDLALSDPWVMKHYSAQEEGDIKVVKDLGAIPLVMAVGSDERARKLQRGLKSSPVGLCK